jgi:hypothetical protein
MGIGHENCHTGIQCKKVRMNLCKEHALASDVPQPTRIINTWLNHVISKGHGSFYLYVCMYVPKRRHITIRMWLSHVISIASEASTEKFCIDICTSSLQNQKSADRLIYKKKHVITDRLYKEMIDFTTL